MAEWSKLEFAPGRDDLLRLGAIIPVQFASLEGDAWIACEAEIDTGAMASAVSPSLFERLAVPASPDFAIVHEPSKPAASVSACRAAIKFPDGVEIERDFLILESLHERDALIGRDILRNGLLAIDFIGGHFTLMMDWDMLGKD